MCVCVRAVVYCKKPIISWFLKSGHMHACRRHTTECATHARDPGMWSLFTWFGRLAAAEVLMSSLTSLRIGGCCGGKTYNFSATRVIFYARARAYSEPRLLTWSSRASARHVNSACFPPVNTTELWYTIPRYAHSHKTNMYCHVHSHFHRYFELIIIEVESHAIVK